MPYPSKVLDVRGNNEEFVVSSLAHKWWLSIIETPYKHAFNLYVHHYIELF